MPTPHLLIPLAANASDGCRTALATLRLPNLERLLNRLTPTLRDNGEDTSLSPPHERALARHYGLPVADGLIPWAAQEAQQDGAWAFITPCHWQVMTDHIVMAPPDTLGLEEAESRAVLAAVQPFFEEDGISLTYATPTRWLAQGEIFAAWPPPRWTAWSAAWAHAMWMNGCRPPPRAARCGGCRARCRCCSTPTLSAMPAVRAGCFRSTRSGSAAVERWPTRSL